jgi:hypothetical protein
VQKLRKVPVVQAKSSGAYLYSFAGQTLPVPRSRLWKNISTKQSAFQPQKIPQRAHAYQPETT